LPVNEEIRMGDGKRNSDARRFTRVPFKRSVRVKAGNNEIFLGHAGQDISQGGLRVMSSVFFPVNSRLYLQFQLKDLDRVLEVRGRVAWVRFNPLTEMYQMGLDFSDESAFKRGLIIEFIQAR
jgi:hypothetical protein